MKFFRFGLILLILIVGIIPVFLMFITSIWDSNNIHFEHYIQLFTNVEAAELLLNSITLGCITVFGTLILGIPISLILTKTNIPFKKFIKTIIIIPIFLPPYILAVAWKDILGRYGLINNWLGIGEYLSQFLNSIWGCAFILVFSYLPLTILFIGNALKHINSEVEDSARCDSSEFKIFLHITLPLIIPSILSSALLTFVLTISEFGVPMILNTNVFTSEIFIQFAAFYNFGKAVTLSFPLILLTIIFMLWERSKLKHTDIANIDESTRNFRILFLKRRKKLLLLFPCIIFALLIVFPIILILIYSINYDSYSKAFQFAEDGILISFLSGIFGSTSLVILGFIIAYNVERYKKEYFNTILLLLFAVPATIVGISLIKFWNQPIFSGIIYNTFVMFIISYLARFLILTERVFVSTLKQIPIAYEEMAQLDGASRLTIFAKIIFPNIRSAIATAWIIGFIFCFGELATTIIVYPAGGATLPIRLYTIMANSPESIVHAMSMFIIVPILIAAISVNLLFKFILKMNIYSI